MKVMRGLHKHELELHRVRQKIAYSSMRSDVEVSHSVAVDVVSDPHAEQGRHLARGGPRRSWVHTIAEHDLVPLGECPIETRVVESARPSSVR